MKQRFEELDSLRGIAAMSVLVFHCLISFPLFYNANYSQQFSNKLVEFFTSTPLKLLWSGNEPVLLFFVLSGFVLALPFLKRADSPGPAYWTYAIKRFCRIYIPYIAIMAVSIIIMTAFANHSPDTNMSPTYNDRWDHAVSIKAIVAYILMLNYDTTNVNGVVWTLFHEMRISLIFPLLMIAVVRFSWIKSLLLTFTFTAVAFVAIGYLSNFTPDGLTSVAVYSLRETVYYTPFFLLGAVLAKYRTSLTSIFQPFNRLVKWMLTLLSLTLISNNWLFYTLSFKQPIAQDLMTAIGILLLFIIVISSNTRSVLTTKPLLFLGKISYSLYLVHIPVIMLSSLYLSKFISMQVAFLLVPVISVPIAYFSYKFIELPSISAAQVSIKWLSTRKLSSFKLITPQKKPIIK